MTPAEVFAEVLAEHCLADDNIGVACPCGEIFADVEDWITHVAERLAACMEQVGERSKPGPTAELEPLFRLIPRESETP